MSRAVIQVPVTWDRAARKRDRTVGLSFSTNLEISNEDFAQMDRQVLSTGFLLFAENELPDEEVPTEDAATRRGKSKGARMRAVWFLKWKKRHIDEPFEPWYDKQFESWMDRWKEELE